MAISQRLTKLEANTQSHPRLTLDLAARQQVFGEERVIRVPAGSEGFWQQYASVIRLDRPFQLEAVEAPPYPAANGKVALWYSGGVESTYSLDSLKEIEPDLLSIHDYALFSSEHRRVGQIHFLCVALAAAAGYSRVFLGVERDDLLLARNRRARRYFERTPGFLKLWSDYQPEHPAESVCSGLYKEEIMLRLQNRGLRVTGTCDRLSGGQWCGDCYKCFEAFYTAKAAWLELGIRLSRAAYDRYHAEYRRYVDSEFTDSYNNAYHHYARLQITYGLAFEPERDTVA